MTPEEENIQLRAALRDAFDLIYSEWGCDYQEVAKNGWGWTKKPDLTRGAQLLVEEDLKNESHHS